MSLLLKGIIGIWPAMDILVESLFENETYGHKMIGPRSKNSFILLYDSTSSWNII